MPWSSDDEEEDRGWTLEANTHRAAYDRRRMGTEWEAELWTLYRSLIDYSESQGFPFFAHNRLGFDDFVEFVLAHS